MASTVLVVEDERKLRDLVRSYLERAGFTVLSTDSGAEAITMALTSAPDLVILDLGLPDVPGETVARELRATGPTVGTPILMLTAKTAEEDRIRGLELGADDYVTKPFGTAELLARLHALLRRSAGPAADAVGRMAIGPLVLDAARHAVTVGERPVELTPREFEVLRVLLTHQGRLVTRGRLLRAVWGEAYQGEDHYVHVYVSQIRRKLAAVDADGALRDLIVTEPGVGYRVRGA